MRIRSCLLLPLVTGLPLAGCAATPTHYPSETATHYVGKRLLDLEMHWSTPWDISGTEGAGQKATWRFDQYNLAGCSVTAHTDATGIIRNVEWTRGCGPKGTETAPTGSDEPEG